MPKSMYLEMNCVELRPVKNGWHASETQRHITGHGHSPDDAVLSLLGMISIFDRALSATADSSEEGEGNG